MIEPTNSEVLDIIWDYNDAAKSEAGFREFLAHPLEASVKAEALTQLARSLGLQKRFEEALEVLRESEGLEQGGRPQVRLLLERGRALNSSERAAEARPLFVRAWDLAKEIGEEGLAVDAAHMVAIVEPEPAGQIEWNERAMELARGSSQPKAKKWAPSLLNNLGWTYHDMGEPERALPLFEEAQRLRKERGEQGEERIARYCVGRCLRTLGRIEEALTIQEDVIRDQGNKGWGYAEEEAGECLLILRRAGDAQIRFAESYAKFCENGALQDEPKRMRRIKNLAGIL